MSGFQQHKAFLPPVCEYPRKGVEKERVGLTDPSIILQPKQRDLKGWAGVNVYIVGTRKLLNHQSLGISLLTVR